MTLQAASPGLRPLKRSPGPDQGLGRDPDLPAENRLPARGPDHGTDDRSVTQETGIAAAGGPVREVGLEDDAALHRADADSHQPTSPTLTYLRETVNV